MNSMNGLLATPNNDPRLPFMNRRDVSSSASSFSIIHGLFESTTTKMGKYPAKDMINHLTKLAAEQRQVASDIVQFLRQKIQQVHPDCKLPLFYLTDSILKNVGGPYLPLFDRVIADLFASSIAMVNERDQTRFAHVLNTWATARVFSPQNIRAMQIAVDRAAHHRRQRRENGQGTNGVDDIELRELLAKLQNEMNVHPAQHMSLEEVRMKNPPFYQQLLSYRDNNKRAQDHPVERTQEQNRPINETTMTMKTSPSPKAVADPAADLNALADENKMSRLLALAKKQRLTPPLRSSPPDDPSRPSQVPSASKIISLLQKAQKLSPEDKHNKSKVTEFDPLALVIKCEKDRIEKNIQGLYAALPLVCRESGLRFKEQKHLDEHLDFIFHYNRSQREKSRGGTSRSWYPNVEQWTTDFSALGVDNARGGETKGSFFDTLDKEKDTVIEEEEKKVPAVEGEYTCRICNEGFERFWDEEEEDWMFRNAVYGTVQNDTPGDSNRNSIFHDHCYAAATANYSKILSSSVLAPGTPQSRIHSHVTTEEENIQVESEDQSSNLKRDENPNSNSTDEEGSAKRQRKT